MRNLILAAVAAMTVGTASASWNYNGIVPGAWETPTRAQSFYTTKPTDATDRVQRRKQNRRCEDPNGCTGGVAYNEIHAYEWEWRVTDNQGTVHTARGNGTAPRATAIGAAQTADLLHILNPTNFDTTEAHVQAQDNIYFDGVGTYEDPYRVNWNENPISAGVALEAKHIGKVYLDGTNVYKLKRERNTLYGQPGQAEWIWSGDKLTVNGVHWSRVNRNYTTSKCRAIKMNGYNTATGLSDPDNYIYITGNNCGHHAKPWDYKRHTQFRAHHSGGLWQFTAQHELGGPLFYTPGGSVWSKTYHQFGANTGQSATSLFQSNNTLHSQIRDYQGDWQLGDCVTITSIPHNSTNNGTFCFDGTDFN